MSGQIGALTPAPGHITTHNNSLSSGMTMSHVEADHGSASILIVAANASNIAATRDPLVRNMYRAARTVFSNDSTLQKATVTVRSGSADGPALVSADIDRASALAADPDNDDLASLTSHVQFH